MRNTSRWNIPQELDKPGRIAIFSQYEGGIIGAAFVGGILFDFVLYGLLGAFIAVFVMRRSSVHLKQTPPQVFIYWLLGLPRSGGLVASWKREWRG